MSTARSKPLRPIGTAPFLGSGDVFVWHYRRRTWTPGVPENAHPMRVIRDDERGLVCWLAGGTTGLRPERVGGGGLRDDKPTMFTAPRHQGTAPWYGPGVVRIVPTGCPWSVWIFRSGPEPEAALSSWYVNLEDPARRTDYDLTTSDLVLDLVVRPDRSIHFKDEDELLLAVEQGRFTPAEAAEITAIGTRAQAWIRSAPWPFDDEWAHWSAPADWTIPVLPQDFSI